MPPGFAIFTMTPKSDGVYCEEIKVAFRALWKFFAATFNYHSPLNYNILMCTFLFYFFVSETSEKLVSMKVVFIVQDVTNSPLFWNILFSKLFPYLKFFLKNTPFSYFLCWRKYSDINFIVRSRNILIYLSIISTWQTPFAFYNTITLFNG